MFVCLCLLQQLQKEGNVISHPFLPSVTNLLTFPFPQGCEWLKAWDISVILTWFRNRPNVKWYSIRLTAPDWLRRQAICQSLSAGLRSLTTELIRVVTHTDSRARWYPQCIHSLDAWCVCTNTHRHSPAFLPYPPFFFSSSRFPSSLAPRSSELTVWRWTVSEGPLSMRDLSQYSIKRLRCQGTLWLIFYVFPQMRERLIYS